MGMNKVIVRARQAAPKDAGHAGQVIQGAALSIHKKHIHLYA